MNAMKFQGQRAVYRELINSFKSLGWGDDGLAPYDLSRALNNFGVKHKLHKKTTVKDIEKMIKRGSAVIVAYDWFDYTGWGSHYTFITVQLGDFFGAHNYYNHGNGYKEDGFFNKTMMNAFLQYTRKERKNSKTSCKWMPAAWEIYG
jgi:hypothetical protein